LLFSMCQPQPLVHARGGKGGRFPFQVPEQGCAKHGGAIRFASAQRAHTLHHVLRGSFFRQVTVNSHADSTLGAVDDLNGNMTSSGTDGYARNRMVSTLSGANFQYDAFGRRTSKTIGGTTTNFLCDGSNPVQEVIGGTNTGNSRVMEGGEQCSI
jgi:hypothetical protein